jgi:hypothetical protein
MKPLNPHKCVDLCVLLVKKKQVQVKCALLYMDFEGRSDGRSVKSIIAHVAPLKLVSLS